MGEHLKVDLGSLDETAHSLEHLKGEFLHASDISSASEAAIGDAQINDALHAFATNWKHHRDGLVKWIDTVTEMTRNSRELYHDSDASLAQSLSMKGPT